MSHRNDNLVSFKNLPAMKRNEMKYISREVENRLVHVFFLGGTFENECSLRFSSYKTGMKAQGLKDESNRTQGKQEMVCSFVHGM